MWQEIEYFDEVWKDRIRLMASYIPADVTSVMDIGCGRMWLRDYLSTGCNYFGIDYTDRGGECYVFDLNNYEFPDFTCDLAFVSGCLEYIDDYKWMVDKMVSQNRACIISYCTLNVFSNVHERAGWQWRNHLTDQELVDLFTGNQMKLLAKDSTVTENSIYVFGR